jgi:hypothetical protein
MKLNQKRWIVFSWVVFVFVLVFVLPNVASASEANGLSESIDTNFSFSPGLLVDILSAYGEEGRAYYITQRWTFDLYYPLVYGVPISLSLNRLIIQPKNRRIAWIGMFASSFDYIENIIFTIAALTFPSSTMVWVTMGVVVSMAKWSALGGGFLLVIGLSLRQLFFRK